MWYLVISYFAQWSRRRSCQTESHDCNISYSESHDAGDVVEIKGIRAYLRAVKTLPSQTITDRRRKKTSEMRWEMSVQKTFHNKLTWVPFNATNDSFCAITESWGWQPAHWAVRSAVWVDIQSLAHDKDTLLSTLKGENGGNSPATFRDLLALFKWLYSFRVPIESADLLLCGSTWTHCVIVVKCQCCWPTSDENLPLKCMNLFFPFNMYFLLFKKHFFKIEKAT